MLSDEEKEAIEYIKKCLDNEYNFKNATRQKDKKAYNIILNLIEKQSKEIEELKEKNKYLPNWVSKKYVSKDKIKAKIEELEKEIITGAKKTDIIRRAIIYELQSLLEKE